MIEIFIRHLPYKVSEQLSIEYNQKMQDIIKLTSGKYEAYTHLKNDINVISLLLSMSIFYRRIFTNFESANKFTRRILTKSDATSIQLGTSELTERDILNLNSTVNKYKKMMEKYNISIELFTYSNSLDFVRKIRDYKKVINSNNNE